MDNKSLEKIQELERAVHTHTVQRQSYEAQLHEIEHARAELQETDEAYKIVGGIMVKTPAKGLLADLDGKHETMQARVGQLAKQEEQLKKEMETVRKEIIGDGHEVQQNS